MYPVRPGVSEKREKGHRYPKPASKTKAKAAKRGKR
jgi:hypothetical protein